MWFLSAKSLGLSSLCFASCAVLSCTQALPIEPRQEGVGVSYSAARDAAYEAKEAADRCRVEAEKSREYLEEARAALQRVEDNQRRAEEARKKEAEKKKRVVIRRPKRPAPVAAPVEAVPLPPVAAPGVPDKPPIKEAPKYPEHSPSDHP